MASADLPSDANAQVQRTRQFISDSRERIARSRGCIGESLRVLAQAGGRFPLREPSASDELALAALEWRDSQAEQRQIDLEVGLTQRRLTREAGGGL